MKTIPLLCAASIIPFLAEAADSPLYSFNIDGPLGDARAQVSMKFEETGRTNATSIVEVSGVTPGSNLANGFLLDGLCGLAESRSQRYFQAKQIQSDPLTLEVTFPETAPNSSSAPENFMAPNVYPTSHCPTLRLMPGRTVKKAAP